MAQVAVIIPLMRPHRIAPVVQSIADSTSDYRIIVLATGACADACKDLPVTLIDDGGGTFPQRMNRGYGESTEQFLMTGADDLSFRPGWFEAARRVLDQIEGGGTCATNDLYNSAGTHFIADRRYIQTWGGVMNQPNVFMDESYLHAYCDDSYRKTAQFHGRWGGVVNDCVVEHLHVGAGRAPHDAVYAAGEATMSQGLAMFQSQAHLWATA